MSSITVQGDASGTGIFTIASPNSNTNRTLSLPDATGTFVTTTETALTALSAASASDMTGVNTTATVTSGTTSMTVGSATGIVAGMAVVARGITPGTTVSTIVGTTVTLSANANATLSAAPVTFYTPSKILTPASVGGQLARAWVNFNGTGTVAIRASFNVSSITDNGTGDYTVNFTTAMVDANYCSVIGGQTGTAANSILEPQTGTRSTTQLQVSQRSYAQTQIDMEQMQVAIFR